MFEDLIPILIVAFDFIFIFLFSIFIILLFHFQTEHLTSLEYQSETLRKTIGDQFEHISATRIIGIPKMQKVVAGGNVFVFLYVCICFFFVCLLCLSVFMFLCCMFVCLYVYVCLCILGLCVCVWLYVCVFLFVFVCVLVFTNKSNLTSRISHCWIGRGWKNFPMGFRITWW